MVPIDGNTDHDEDTDERDTIKAVSKDKEDKNADYSYGKGDPIEILKGLLDDV